MNLPDTELVSVAGSLGSDVPFLLTRGTALGAGRGDQLEPLPAVKTTRLLLVAPGGTISRKTPTLYGALTPDDYSDGEQTRRLADSAALTAATLTSDSCRNVFARAALEIFPGLNDVWERVAAVTKFPPCLSGAGPAFFCMPSDETEHAKVAAALQNTGATAYLIRTISPAHAV